MNQQIALRTHRKLKSISFLNKFNFQFSFHSLRQCHDFSSFEFIWNCRILVNGTGARHVFIVEPTWTSKTWHLFLVHTVGRGAPNGNSLEICRNVQNYTNFPNFPIVNIQTFSTIVDADGRHFVQLFAGSVLIVLIILAASMLGPHHFHCFFFQIYANAVKWCFKNSFISFQLNRKNGDFL